LCSFSLVKTFIKLVLFSFNSSLNTPNSWNTKIRKLKNNLNSLGKKKKFFLGRKKKLLSLRKMDKRKKW